ncbi:MAG: hypothetical protein P1P74_12250 [Desulfuromonadales bacterium]|nr:hypothetical protein [Desulfuromonadales bacterium]
MGQNEGGWQNVVVVLERFGTWLPVARKAYEIFVADGVAQGKRSDLIGGGLIRSSGGWRKVVQKRRTNLESKGDERILGEGSFVGMTASEVYCRRETHEIMDGPKHGMDVRKHGTKKGYGFKSF